MFSISCKPRRKFNRRKCWFCDWILPTFYSVVYMIIKCALIETVDFTEGIRTNEEWILTSEVSVICFILFRLRHILSGSAFLLFIFIYFYLYCNLCCVLFVLSINYSILIRLRYFNLFNNLFSVANYIRRHLFLPFFLYFLESRTGLCRAEFSVLCQPSPRDYVIAPHSISLNNAYVF